MSRNSGKEFQIKVLNKLQNIPEIAKFIDSSLKQFGMKEDRIFDVNVAVDEACTNIIEHAYAPDEEGTIEIRCKMLDENKAAVLIKDDGKPFNQALSVEVDTSAHLDERKRGGLGLFFIRELLDEVYYESRDGYEVLTMVKNLN